MEEMQRARYGEGEWSFHASLGTPLSLYLVVTNLEAL